VGDLYLPAIQNMNGREAWAALESLFSSNNAFTRMGIVDEFFGLERHHKESISAYVTRATGIAAALTSHGLKVETEFLVAAVLRGLRKYPTFNNVIDLICADESTVKSMAKVTTILQGCEAREEKAPTSSEPAAMHAQTSKPSNCEYCKKPRHSWQVCRSLKRDVQAGLVEDRPPFRRLQPVAAPVAAVAQAYSFAVDTASSF
jgi:hypothetical protein